MGEKDSGSGEGKSCSSLSPLPKQRHQLPSFLHVLPGKEQREEADLGKGDLWLQPICSYSPGKEKQRRKNIKGQMCP